MTCSDLASLERRITAIERRLDTRRAQVTAPGEYTLCRATEPAPVIVREEYGPAREKRRLRTLRNGYVPAGTSV